ncbi:endoribonuclease YicC domain-containing protein, partial [Pseudomonas aeruginosa]
ALGGVVASGRPPPPPPGGAARGARTAGGAAGRRLDFLMQELNREANTLGSKAFDPRSTQAAVNLKVLIEQMREQVQNIE